MPITKKIGFRTSVTAILGHCSMSMGELYNQYKDEDGFLYLTYSGENTFGA